MKLEDIELPVGLRTKLLNEGYETVDELKKASLVDLSKGLKLSKQDISKVFEITRGKMPVRHGKNMLEFISEDDDKGIALSSQNLESLFENGIPVRRLTELCGESGTGKTQICMQLAVNVQRPKEKGGLNGECIYIDTEGSFLSYRFIKMINDEDALAYLDKIHLFRVYNHTELIALIRQLPDILAQKFQNKVKLIIIDSIAYHFRMNTMDSRRRDVFLPNLAHLLIRVATNHTLAMVVTNHVTENILDGTWIPALGSAWGNWCAFRLFLFRRRQFRFGYLYKNIEDEDSIVPVQFCIKNYGVTDPGQEEVLGNNNELDSEAITERLENSLGDVKIVKSDDIWSQNLLANDEQLDDIVPTNDPSDSSDSAASNNGIITSNHSSANKNGATTNGESSANKNSAIINNKVPAMPSTSKASTGHNHRALNGLNGNGESSKSPDSGTVPSEQPQAEEAPLANESMDISENTSRASISNVEIPARVKRKRKLVDYTEDDNVQEKLATEISMIVSSESLDTPDQNSTDKRKTKKRKTNEKDEIPEKTNIPNNAEHESAPTNDKKRKAQDKTLPPPKTRKGKKPLPKEDSSDWSDSEIEDDLEFLSHFDEPF